MLAKASELRVNEVVIDLEDAVSPRRKGEALEFALSALERGFAARRVAVRINSVGSSWCEAEVHALTRLRARPDSVVVPKAADPRALVAIAQQLGGIGMQALVESAEGVQRVAELSAVPEVEAVIIGYADLAVSLGRPLEVAAEPDLWLAVQDRVLVAARAAEVRAIDGPFLGIDDDAGLRRSAAWAARLGFDGKWVIHPSHVDSVAEEFTPSEEALVHARAVIDALAAADRAGKGAVRLDGMMLDEPVRLAALRTLARGAEL
jgi:citrate lyase subunit beta/citryl-CoA lyase